MHLFTVRARPGLQDSWVALTLPLDPGFSQRYGDRLLPLLAIALLRPDIFAYHLT
jgi:hypothetical protein